MITIKIPDISVIECDCGDDDFLADKYECTWCNESLEYACECYEHPEAQDLDMDIYCHGCKSTITVAISDLLDEYTPDFEEEKEEPNTEVEGIHYKMVKRCYHMDHAVTFGEVTVYASSEWERDEDCDAPDFGLYLDGSWRPDCLAYLVAWDDYGLPKKYDLAAFAIIDAWNKAKQGLWVEIGCIGGHGRTGTALACMGVLSGMTAKEAVKHVKSTYCNNAIETREQEWWVQWFEAFIKGGRIKKPSFYASDTDAGSTWKWEGPFNHEIYDVTDFPKKAPPEEGGVSHYHVKVKIQPEVTLVGAWLEGKSQGPQWQNDEEPF